MIKKQKSTYASLIESMSSARRKKFDEGYKALLLSEMRLALHEEDHTAAQKLAALAGISLAVFEKDPLVKS